MRRALLFLMLLAACSQPGAGRKPNVVFILADDLGWRDTGVYGSNFYETPAIDALARRGMRFTDAYAASPVCSPTRASLVTGLHPARIGITQPKAHLPEEILEPALRRNGPVNQPALQVISVTRLKLDYFTLAEAFHAAGYRTAHFGKWHLGPEPYDPLHQGFEIDLPHTSRERPTSYLGPWSFWPGKGKPGEHIEDRMAEEASRFMRENRDRTFFLNYWAFSVHAPLGGKRSLIEKYRAKADPQSPQRNPVMGAMVESLDDAVGTLVRTIDELGIADHTIIVFFSDNGGIVHLVTEGSPATSNLPLRSGKSSIYEGGVRVPLVIVWPGRTRPGSTSSELVQSIDLFPTLLAMTGVAVPAGQRFDGVSIVPALEGGHLEREAIFTHHPHYAAPTAHKPSTSVRQGDWKLIRFYADGPGQTDRFELYNLRDDIGERNDLSEAEPEKVAELEPLIERFLAQTGAVVPKPNPAYQPGQLPFPDGPVTRQVECVRCF